MLLDFDQSDLLCPSQLSLMSGQGQHHQTEFTAPRPTSFIFRVCWTSGWKAVPGDLAEEWHQPRPQILLQLQTKHKQYRAAGGVWTCRPHTSSTVGLLCLKSFLFDIKMLWSRFASPKCWINLFNHVDFHFCPFKFSFPLICSSAHWCAVLAVSNN